MRLFFKRPKSHFKKDGTLKASAPLEVLKRPDVDNCLKFVLDSLQPAIMIDDFVYGRVTPERFDELLEVT